MVIEDQSIITVDDLTVEFNTSARGWATKSRRTRAVDGASFSINEGEVLGLVGESGCGKTTVGRTVVGLYRPSHGQILYRGEPLSDMSPERRQRMRRHVQMVFQDPYASLNPRMTVEDLVSEPLRAHRIGTKKERQARVGELLGLVGLDPTAAGRFPGAFSGGQRQRIGIARALSLKPEFIVADEPVSALDVSIQAQIVNLLTDIQRELGLSMLVIAHDLAVIEHISDRVAVMYLGRLVEIGNVDAVLGSPLHPYTKALISAVPTVDPDENHKPMILEGEVPSPFAVPQGCRFHTRCPLAMDVCKEIDPAMVEVEPGRQVACHLVGPSIHPPAIFVATPPPTARGEPLEHSPTYTERRSPPLGLG